MGPSRVSMYRHTGFIMREHVEDVERYTPGGYHPVDIGDTITNRQDSDDYTVVHKLGHGGFSTVWLAKRQRKQPLDSTGQPQLSFHALKILRADLGDARASHELHFLQRLGQVGRSSHPNLVMLEDSFTVSGPNGQHRCLVFPLVAFSLYSDKSRSLTPSQRHDTCQQLASAVAFLHSHGVCHGDLTSSNIVFKVPSMQSMIESRLLELLGPIKEETLRLCKGPVSHSTYAPKKVVASASFSGLDSSSLATVQIIDFGCAFSSNSPPPTLGCPVECFPPELLFDYPASTKSDVWQLAALVYYTSTGQDMFQVGFQIFTHLVAFVVRHHGPVPALWKGKFVWSKYGLAQPGQPVAPSPEPDWWWSSDDKRPIPSLEYRFAKRASYLSAAQRDELARLLRDMVAWEPSCRISAAEADRRLKAPVFSSLG
ncbi:kinase-like domain-containing protein [Chaetomidium leptoderma]|uniref:EKC/KEOPS complex subunit BUD32 n=1 Tax=Chaetomidium leptoderma TaxID=669021 RepID=A0AAN6ZXK4_9PEZI|nr:kinase-like domain-containing protein [Chaetomidium leptoderma]